MLADNNCYCKMTSVMAGVRWCNIVYAGKKLQIHGNVWDTVGFPQCNGGKLEEAQGFKCIFILYCVLESKKISSIA